MCGRMVCSEAAQSPWGDRSRGSPRQARNPAGGTRTAGEGLRGRAAAHGAVVKKHRWSGGKVMQWQSAEPMTEGAQQGGKTVSWHA